MLPEVIERARTFLRTRQWYYQRTFNNEVGKEVLKDLAVFCRAHASTFHDNERVAAKLDGRREVFLRITQHMKLTPDQLWALTSGIDDAA